MQTFLETTLKNFTKPFQEGPTKLIVKKGVENIDGWIDNLAKADFRGAKVIHDNLGKLKSLLEADTLDGPAIGKMLKTVAEETARTAAHASGPDGEKITKLSDMLLSGAGQLGK